MPMLRRIAGLPFAALIMLVPARAAAQMDLAPDTLAIAMADLPLHGAPHAESSFTAVLRTGDLARVVAVSPDGEWRDVRTREARGWVPAERLIPFDSIYTLVAHKALARYWLQRTDAGADEFAAAVDALTLRLATARIESNDRTELAFLRYRLLQTAADAVMRLWYDDRREEYEAMLPWIALHADELVYGEPQGRWLVWADLLWQLHDASEHPGLREAIAWYASSQPTPGECEGYLPCIFHRARHTDGRYLDSHPQGAHADEVVESLGEALTWMADNATEEFGRADLCTEVVHSGALADLRATVEGAGSPAVRAPTLAAMARVAATCDGTP